jgi:protein involved in polysaccharide export with SLBB domain
MNPNWRDFLLGLTAFLSVSCSARNGAFKTAEELSQPTGFHQEYRLQLGDEIEVKFFMSPELNQDVIVRPDGHISLQLLDDVAAAGLTPNELDTVITERYRSELRDPQITVAVKRLAAKVYVGGEVRQPRFVALGGSLTVLQAVFEAGGFTDTAEPSSVILLRRLNQEKGIAAKIDLKKVISAEAEDISLMPSDTIFIPKSTIAEVNLFVEQYITKNIPVPISIPVAQ